MIFSMTQKREMTLKHALITGASRGIGAAMVKHFAELKYDLTLCAQNKKRLNDFSDDIQQHHPDARIETIALDYNQPEAVDEACSNKFSLMPVPDVFFASAGVSVPDMLEAPSLSWQKVYQVNVLSTIAICNLVSKRMAEAGGGHIFIMGSNSAYIHKGYSGAYGSSKAAIVHYAETLFHLMLKDRVKVTCLCPGLVNTDMTRDDLPFDEEEVIQTKDLVDTVQWVMGLSSGASIPSLRIQCAPLVVARNEAE